MDCQHLVSKHGHWWRSKFWEWCSRPATWRIMGHGWGNITHDRYYCDQHYQEHISKYKLDLEKDVVRIGEANKKGVAQ